MPLSKTREIIQRLKHLIKSHPDAVPAGSRDSIDSILSKYAALHESDETWPDQSSETVCSNKPPLRTLTPLSHLQASNLSVRPKSHKPSPQQCPAPTTTATPHTKMKTVGLMYTPNTRPTPATTKTQPGALLRPTGSTKSTPILSRARLTRLHLQLPLTTPPPRHPHLPTASTPNCATSPPSSAAWIASLLHTTLLPAEQQ